MKMAERARYQSSRQVQLSAEKSSRTALMDVSDDASEEQCGELLN